MSEKVLRYINTDPRPLPSQNADESVSHVKSMASTEKRLRTRMTDEVAEQYKHYNLKEMLLDLKTDADGGVDADQRNRTCRNPDITLLETMMYNKIMLKLGIV